MKLEPLNVKASRQIGWWMIGEWLIGEGLEASILKTIQSTEQIQIFFATTEDIIFPTSHGNLTKISKGTVCKLCLKKEWVNVELLAEETEVLILEFKTKTTRMGETHTIVATQRQKTPAEKAATASFLAKHGEKLR